MNKKYNEDRGNISHNPEVAGSNPVSAISRNIERYSFFLCLKRIMNLRPTEESQFKLEHPEENGAAAKLLFAKQML